MTYFLLIVAFILVCYLTWFYKDRKQQDLTKEIDDYKKKECATQELEGLLKLVKEKQSEVTELGAQIVLSHSEKAKIDAASKEEQEKLQAINDLSEKNAELVREREQLQAVIGVKQTDLKMAENKLKETEQKLIATNEKINQQQEQFITDQKKQHLDLLKNDEDRRKAFETEQNEKKKEAEERYQKKENDYADKLREAENTLSQLNKKIQENQNVLARLNDYDRQIAFKENRLKDLDKEISKNQALIKDGLEQLSKMNLSGVQTLRLKAFEPLREGEGTFALRKDGESTYTSKDEKQALKDVANHFKSSGFEVPKRLLYAFHTSLKTSNMSSLTVMAGVSGTGKSAIPKLYAESMGIYFSPLAVEPRWDSPKDLMGFFNYVTNRYEPTTLARAMFQFQGHWSKAFAPKVPLDKYLFMPMLDEMNLARIEYYFSEFLSKLEMRRLVNNELSDSDIASISMEVFQGYTGVEDEKKVAEPPIRLFANTNTLFVGTMNEDETTQSLSDKVIDRANVLYFGQPKNLKSSCSDEKYKFNPRNPLTLETWKSWCSETRTSKFKKTEAILSELNKELAKFNRPFAHRTFQAILSYIANYPKEASEEVGERCALADQIGMRIMPKLRGIDLSQNQETLDNIKAILENDVSDYQLSDAFKRACDVEGGTGFFRWNGFDWVTE